MPKPTPQISITLPNGANAEVSGGTISKNPGVIQGLACILKVVTPNFTNNVTTTVRIYDQNGILLYASPALSRNSGAAGHAVPINVPLYSKEVVKAQPSADPGGTGGAVTINIDYIPDTRF